STAWGDIGDPVLTFEASNALGSGTFTVSPDDGAWDGNSWFWMALGPIEIYTDTGDLIATFTQGSAFIDEDPLIGMGFAVLNGDLDATISISSSNITFDTIFGAQGRASAGMTMTESNGDTATLIGLEAGGTMFSADYNGTTPFADLLAGPFSAGAFSTTDATDEYPDGGAFAAMGDVSDISVDWSFELSANDQASGTSVFVVIPTPASLALIAVGGLFIGRRRR
ncbi:hypothetical protein MNBD_PLANCTO03-2387, partial [hydrothermal vent metagenome]